MLPDGTPPCEWAGLMGLRIPRRKCAGLGARTRSGCILRTVRPAHLQRALEYATVHYDCFGGNRTLPNDGGYPRNDGPTGAKVTECVA